MMFGKALYLLFFVALPLTTSSHDANAAVAFTPQDIELAKSACLAGSRFSLALKADGSVSLKELTGKGEVSLTKDTIDIVSVPDADKRTEFDAIRECVRNYLVYGGKNKADVNTYPNRKCVINGTGSSVSLMKDQKARWTCLGMSAGKYRASFSVGGSPIGVAKDRMTRVSYAVYIHQPSAPDPTNDKELTSARCADFNVPDKPGLCSPVFRTNSDEVDIYGGDVTFILSIVGVYSHDNFADPNSGSVTLNEGLVIRMDAIQ